MLKTQPLRTSLLNHIKQKPSIEINVFHMLQGHDVSLHCSVAHLNFE